MDAFQAVVLAIIQGLTEFLPVSSSGHLVLPSVLLGWPDQGLAFDVAVHVGSLTAVLLYFRRDVVQMLFAWGQSLGGRQSDDGRLAWMVILSTLPAVVAGLLLGDLIENHLRNGWVLATTTLVFGVALAWADSRSDKQRPVLTLGWQAALFIGVAQAMALVPGTSRSGITMTAALLIGFGRADAARYSFLLSMPLILAAGTLKTLELMDTGSAVPWGLMALGTVVSAITAYLCIHVFLSWIERIGMLPFAVYRVLLAMVLFGLLIGGWIQ